MRERVEEAFRKKRSVSLFFFLLPRSFSSSSLSFLSFSLFFFSLSLHKKATRNTKIKNLTICLLLPSTNLPILPLPRREQRLGPRPHAQLPLDAQYQLPQPRVHPALPHQEVIFVAGPDLDDEVVLVAQEEAVGLEEAGPAGGRGRRGRRRSRRVAVVVGVAAGRGGGFR